MNRDVFKAEVEVPKQRILDMFVGACEGGSNYWCGRVEPLGTHDDAYEAMLGGFVATDNETGQKIRVTPDDVAAAVGLMATKHTRHFADMVQENDDASTADVFLQLCCFRDVIYG